jgi:hypothetical protein
MTHPKVIVPAGGPTPSKRRPGNSPAGWRWIGWLGAVLALAGAGEALVGWLMADLGAPRWALSGLPLLTIGLLALFAAAMALGRPRLIRTVSAVLAAAAVLVVVATTVLLTEMPGRLGDAAPERSEARAALVRSVWHGLVFGFAYVAGAVAGFRHANRL